MYPASDEEVSKEREEWLHSIPSYQRSSINKNDESD